MSNSSVLRDSGFDSSIKKVSKFPKGRKETNIRTFPPMSETLKDIRTTVSGIKGLVMMLQAYQRDLAGKGVIARIYSDFKHI